MKLHFAGANFLAVILAGISVGIIIGLKYEHLFKLYFGNEIIKETVAEQLHREVRVLCWVLIDPSNHYKIKHIRSTWGKRCNVLLFMSSVEDPESGTIGLPVREGRDNLGLKTREAFKYIFAHHYRDADWFLKCDDDTFVFVENLRYLLYAYSPQMPLHFGHKLNVPSELKRGYFSGGAGYVLSKEALRLLIRVGLPDLCPFTDRDSEDKEIGKCLERIGVVAGDSRIDGRQRFFLFPMAYHLVPPALPTDHWYYRMEYYPIQDGPDCCTKDTISFHYIDTDTMHVIEYLAYGFRSFGVASKIDTLPAKLSWQEVIENIESYEITVKQENVVT